MRRSWRDADRCVNKTGQRITDREAKLEIILEIKGMRIIFQRLKLKIK